MIRLSSSRYRRSPRTRESPKQPMPVKSQIPNRLFLGVALAALFWLPEGDRLANVLAGAERIQDESGDVGSRNRRRDRTRADACSVAAGAWAHCQAGRANDGVIEATLANGLLLQVLVRVGPPHDQSKEHALQYPRVAPTVPDAEGAHNDEPANACGLQRCDQVPRALRKDVCGLTGGGEGDAKYHYRGVLAVDGGVE